MKSDFLMENITDANCEQKYDNLNEPQDFENSLTKRLTHSRQTKDRKIRLVMEKVKPKQTYMKSRCSKWRK